MKVTKTQLRKMITEELNEFIAEEEASSGTTRHLKSAWRSFTGTDASWDEKEYFAKLDDLEDMLMNARDDGALEQKQVDAAFRGVQIARKVIGRGSR